MELKLLLIFASLSVVLVVSSHARPLPVIKLVTDLLQNDVVESENQFTWVGSHEYAAGESEEINLALIGFGHHKYEEKHGYNEFLDNPNFTLFFLPKDLHEGKIMNFVPLKTKNVENLLPRKIAETIPFSSKDLSEIFEKFSVKPESKEAENIKATLRECEQPVMEGEEKYCATSLESMIEFIVSKLGENVQAISTDAHEQQTQNQNQKQTLYKISRANKINGDDNNDKAGICHKQNYPYAVFHCHSVSKSDAFSVTLIGEENGGKIEAAAVCHKDTSDWDPKYPAFKLLNVKPGVDVPVCHFLPENHILWVRK